MKPLAITPGDPGGIGPDLCIKAAVDGELDGVVIADAHIMAQRAAQLGLVIRIENSHAYNPNLTRGIIYIDHISAQDPENPPGLSLTANASYCLQCLDHGMNKVQAKNYSALVTGPLNKGNIRDGGFPNFIGHTEYLRDYFDRQKVVMMLASKEARVALVTTHVPLREVPDAITQTEILNTTEIVIHAFQQALQIPRPRIHVLGINPHAGENGHLGHEDDAIIRPAVTQLRSLYPKLYINGPLPADTAFTPEMRAKADVTIAMYHDQGLPIVKGLGFGDSVNITLGLPIIRTSVDHGTALELAGRGLASTKGLIAAISAAKTMARQ